MLVLSDKKSDGKMPATLTVGETVNEYKWYRDEKGGVIYFSPNISLKAYGSTAIATEKVVYTMKNDSKGYLYLDTKTMMYQFTKR